MFTIFVYVYHLCRDTVMELEAYCKNTLNIGSPQYDYKLQPKQVSASICYIFNHIVDFVSSTNLSPFLYMASLLVPNTNPSATSGVNLTFCSWQSSGALETCGQSCFSTTSNLQIKQSQFHAISTSMSHCVLGVHDDSPYSGCQENVLGKWKLRTQCLPHHPLSTTWFIQIWLLAPCSHDAWGMTRVLDLLFKM